MLQVYQQILYILPGVVAVITTGVMLLLAVIRKFNTEELQQLTSIPLDGLNLTGESLDPTDKITLYGFRGLRVIVVVFEVTTIASLLSFALYDIGAIFRPENIKFLSFYFGLIGGLVVALWYTITTFNMKKLLNLQFFIRIVIAGVSVGLIVFGIGALVTLTSINSI